MFRKIASISVALVVAGGVMIAVPADAAVKISNGVACKKSGQTTKTSGGTYRCAKNPLVSNAKLTWLTLDCLSTATAAVKSQKAAVVTAENFSAQIPIIELGISTEVTNRSEIQSKLDAGNKRLVDAQAKLAAAVTTADKTKLSQAVRDWTAATRAYSSLIRSKDFLINKLEASKLIAVNKPAELKSSVDSARASAKLLCTKGF